MEPHTTHHSVASILVVDENEGFRALADRYLTNLGYRVQAGQDRLDQIDRALTEDWQAILLGFESFDPARLEIVRRVRRLSDVPVLLIGADMVSGLEAGADACLPRDCSIRQLLACLRAVSRRASLNADTRSKKAAPEEFTIADLRIVPDLRRVSLADRELALTPSQFDLLVTLAKTCGRVKTRDDLYAEVRAREYGAFDRSVDVQMSCLRKKLGDDPKRPRFIRTVRSIGYMLVNPDAP